MNGYNDKMGTYNGVKVFCPVNGWDCPYFHGGLCVMQGGDPMEDCDDFASIFDSWEDWEGLDAPEDDSVDESNYDPFMGCDFFEVDMML